MASVVANRYAGALADLVIEDSGGVPPRQMVEELRDFETALRDAPDLSGILSNPAVPPPRKRAVVSRLADMIGCSQLVRNLLHVLIDRRRITFLAEIREAFEGLLDERMGVIRANVTSAAAMSGDERQALEAKLSTVAAKKVRCEYAVDQELLGGATVRLASTVYDGSVKGRLEAIGNKLTE